MPDAIEQLRRLREWRSRRDGDLAIGPLVAGAAERAERSQGRLGTFVSLWEGLLPADLAAHTRVTSVRGGVAHVRVDSSATAYELDRRLREGLEHTLRAAWGRTLVRVKVTVGSIRG